MGSIVFDYKGLNLTLLPEKAVWISEWQVLLIASGVLLWGMFLIGVMLAGLWIWALIAGSTIDRAKKIYFEMEIEGK